MRLEIATPPTTDPVSLAISPDGQKIVFAATLEVDPGCGCVRWILFGKAVDRNGSWTSPFWSPDSRSMGFFADGKLKRIDIDGGVVQTLADAPLGRGGTWNRDGVILFIPSFAGANSDHTDFCYGRGNCRQCCNQGRCNVRFPQFLPDGRHFLYYVPSAQRSEWRSYRSDR